MISDHLSITSSKLNKDRIVLAGHSWGSVIGSMKILWPQLLNWLTPKKKMRLIKLGRFPHDRNEMMFNAKTVVNIATS
jgi:hypothetical protein